MKRIEGRAKTIRELMDGAKYTIDFYQREYAWKERQLQELVDDLTGKFLDFFDGGHARYEVENYGHYFLGSIVISHKRGQKFIVDGQQRMTTLTLFLIFLQHLQGDREDQVEVKKLVYSEKYGRKSFNLDVPDRLNVMEKLLNNETLDVSDENESVQNIAARYENFSVYFPEEIDETALPYFIDWLLENVHFVEIEAYSDEDAYTIFETMNDRGLSLSLPDMLKGYVLANIRHEEDQRKVNDVWKKHMLAFKALENEEDVDFFKNWLRAHHADSIRQGKKGSENRDYERIGTEFHRWIRDYRERLDLVDSEKFTQFVLRDLDFYAKQTLVLRKAARETTEGLEAVYFNAERGFTLQTQVILAALHPDQSPEEVAARIRMVASFVDIWVTRRVWNFKTVSYSSVKYTLFNVTRDLRNKSLEELGDYLATALEQQTETFASNKYLRLHLQNYRHIRHILARITHWVDESCGLPSHFTDLVSQGRARQYEIEHLWANHPKRYKQFYEHPEQFEKERNRLGGLILLQRGLNQSLNDAPYKKKLKAYVSKGQNLLARSLHPLAYENNPSFHQLMQNSGIQFRAHEDFNPEDQKMRQALYTQIAEQVWSIDRVKG